jgi:PKD repeat protein
MKKIFTLLLSALILFNLRPIAQTTSVCNATFNFSILNSNTLKFTPSIIGDSPLVHHDWSFGDATPVSQFIAPTHTYAAPGTYTIKHYLSRYNPNGVLVCAETMIKQVVIQSPCNLTAYFTWGIVDGSPLTATFKNESTPITSKDSVRWTFGDGTSSLDVSPKHTYANPGNFKVCLRVKKNDNAPGTESCVREFCKTIEVNQYCNMVASFNWNSVTGNPATIEFKNLSTPIAPTDSVRWTFGDGSSSLDVNVKHTYANPGTYTACLRVKKNSTLAGTAPCVREICKTIIINQPCNLVASFNWNSVTGNPAIIEFKNLSTPIAPTDSVRWTFGDGSSSLDVNVKHTYANPGTYTACLRVKKNSTLAGTAPCVGEICKTIIINQPCNLVASFNWNSVAGNTSAIEFKNLSTPITSTDSVRWTFGDGTASLDVNTKHVYSRAGTYSVCLRVKKNSNAAGTVSCVSEICKNVIIPSQENCNGIHLNYTYQKDPSIPNKIFFYAVSDFSTGDQNWTITRVYNATQHPVILRQKNPAYVFYDTGYYQVCLKVSALGGCSKEYCRTIRIERVAQLCDFQTYPNPANSLLNVAVHLLQKERIQVLVYNAMNVLVKEIKQEGNIGNNTVTINIKDWLPGLYSIKVIYGNNSCYSRFTKL